NIKKSKLEITETKNEVQLWHYKQFEDYINSGFDLLFPYEDVTLDEIKEPFKKISNELYSLDIDVFFSSTNNILILPHQSFYTSEQSPLPVIMSWKPNCFYNLTIIFKKLTKPEIFKKDKPFAKVMPMSKDINFIEMSEEEKNFKIKKK